MTSAVISEPVLAGNPRPASPRFHQLDGLRAVAAVMVMLRHSVTAGLKDAAAHSPLSSVASFIHEMSASGVELFFVLSGVVLLRPYLRSGRTFDPNAYVRRRVERLWPPFLAAWVLSGLVVLLERAMPTWWTRRTPGLPTFSTSGWLRQLPIINLGGWPSYNAAWWSLGVEMLFYISVILLIPLLIGRSRPRVASVALVLLSVPISLIFALSVPHLPPPLVRLLTHVPLPVIQLLRYGPCFALGVLLAALDIPAGLAAGGLIVGFIWAIAAAHTPALDIELGWAIFYASLISLTLRPVSVIGRVLGAPPLVWLGERSYSLFLSHFAVFSAVCTLLSRVMRPGGAFWVLSRAIEYTAALLVSMVIFHTIEQRFARNLMTAEQILPPLRLRRPADTAKYVVAAA